jgi:hypothetical protein
MFWLHRWWNALRPGRVNRDIDRELAFHVAERARELGDEGLSAVEAARQARIRLGHTRVQAERVHDVNVSLRVESLVRNVRYSVRALSRTPGFTIAVVLTLALGIGANSAVFSALDVVLLRPLPFPEADRLVQLRQAQKDSPETNIAPIRLEDWNRLNRTFDAITGYYSEDVSDTSGELPVIVRRAFVAPRFHDVWGIAPALGRGFTTADYVPGGPLVALVSDRYWRDQPMEALARHPALAVADPRHSRCIDRAGERASAGVGQSGIEQKRSAARAKVRSFPVPFLQERLKPVGVDGEADFVRSGEPIDRSPPCELLRMPAVNRVDQKE